MEFRVLGPLEVVDRDGPIALGGTKQRALLAYLLLHTNKVVSADRLIDVLWGDEPPETVTHTLHVHVSQVRKMLRTGDAGQAELVTEGQGYALRIPPTDLDLNRFLSGIEEGRRELALGQAREAAAELRRSLELWRGEPLADLPYGAVPPAEITRLTELHIAAEEDRIEADLRLGRHADLVWELGPLVAANPQRERLREQQMLALYRSGRQAEALSTYRAYREMLREELGIDPSASLQQLERRILQQATDLNLEPTPALEGGRRSPHPRRSTVGFLIATSVMLVGIGAATVALRSHSGPGPDAVDPNAVGRIDPETGALTESIVTAGTGASPIVWADGSIWVANTESRTVARIDPDTVALVSSIPTDGAPTGVAVDPGSVWVLNGLQGTVDVIDSRTNSVVQRIDVGPGSGGIAAGAGFVWVTNAVENTVSKINPETSTIVQTISLGPAGSASPTAIAAGRGSVWVGDGLAARMWRIDPRTNRVRRGPGLLGVPTAIAVAPDGEVWVVSDDRNLVQAIDPSTMKARSYTIGYGPVALAVSATGVWTAQARDGTVTRLDPVSGVILWTTAIGGAPGGIATGGDSVWVSRPG